MIFNGPHGFQTLFWKGPPFEPFGDPDMLAFARLCMQSTVYWGYVSIFSTIDHCMR